jgi:aminoglycoside phosphotransferase family enzyme
LITEDQSEVAAFLGDPRSHGEDAGEVERIDTHGAMVFLTKDAVYKLKRAVKFPYMDFSTADKRRGACQAEIEVNRRTAPTIYKGVAAIVRKAGGGLAIGRLGETPSDAIDWLVVMDRFDQRGLFDRLAARGALDDGLMTELAAAIAAFHAKARRRFDHGGARGIAWVIEENLRALGEDAPAIFDKALNDRLDRLWHEALARHGELLDRRRVDGFVRHCHGDLHLRNICVIDAKPTLFDAIEFNQAIACIDVLYDLAFLLMDLERRGLRGQANLLFNHYLALAENFGDDNAPGNVAGLAALGLFLSCRAGVRAQTSAAAAISQADEAGVRRLEGEARNYQKMAVDFLAPEPARLIAIGGFSGSGKSTLARRLAPAIGAAPGALVWRSDVVRKRMFGVDPLTPLGPEGYEAPVSRRVFAAIERRSLVALGAGHAVITDAVFANPVQRQAIEQVAKRAGVRFTGLWLDTPPEAMEARLAGRENDASDATPEVLHRQLERPPGPIGWHRIDASGGIDATVDIASACLA